MGWDEMGLVEIGLDGTERGAMGPGGSGWYRAGWDWARWGAMEMDGTGWDRAGRDSLERGMVG